MLESYDPSRKTERQVMQENWTMENADGASEARPQTFGPLLVFLLASIAAVQFQNVSFMGLMPESLLPILGQPPSPQLISIALSVYFVSMVVINSHGICMGTKPNPSWVHLGYRCTFYVLYFTADALPENLIAVLICGLILATLEYLGGRAYLAKRQTSSESAGEA